MIKLINNIINIEVPTVEAHPGIAKAVVVLIIRMATIEITDTSMSRKEIIAILIMIVSRKTAMAPNP